ncbi:MAG: hypothetical protein KIB45_06105 [Negativicoccus succinicivorans]|uniref:hypothetical protein n=1 Tax=Negativicoccus succinicivorans TaxID=620903 RepID=UPI002355B9FC|nr:hypothetical protein [Negativicoccus succinicivorans]MBS5890637.1 hypothetical protein [Negativicoccus succinicivorans]
MTATAEQWKMYQAVKASLRQEQQNVLAEIEGRAANTEPGVTLAEVVVFNDHVNDLRGGEYFPLENRRFLIELGNVDISALNWPTVQSLFDGVGLYHAHGGWRFAIRLSDYFSKVIGTYIRDEFAFLITFQK